MLRTGSRDRGVSEGRKFGVVENKLTDVIEDQ